MRLAAGFAVGLETIFRKYRIYKTVRAAHTSYRQERENEKEDYRTDPAFFRKGSGWNDVDIYNKSVGTSG